MSTTAATVISCFLKKSFARVCVCVGRGGTRNTNNTTMHSPRKREMARQRGVRSLNTSADVLI